MTEKNRFRAPPLAIKLGDASASAPNAGPLVPTRVQILRTGEFNDPRYGTFQIKKEDLSAMKKNFDDKVRGVDIAIDYAHQSDLEAAGWIQGLELADDGNTLWANPVKWTSKANLALGEGEFRYLSADFTFKYTDNESGKEYGPCLLGAGLTNRPVIKEMNPIIELQEGKGDKMSKEMEAKCKELEEKLADAQKKLEEFQSKKKDDPDNDGDDDSSDEGDSDSDKEDMKKQMAAMKAKLASYEANEKKMAEEKKLAEKKGEFEKLLSEGKTCEAQRESFMSGDMAAFVKLAQPVKLSRIGHSNDVETTVSDAQHEVIKLAHAKLSEKKANDIGEAMSMVLRENPALHARYVKETTI